MIADDILLIDAGNSNIKWNCCRADSGLLGADTHSVAYQDGAIEQQLNDFIQRHGAIQHAVISNVAGDKVKYELQQCLVSGNKVSTTFVQTEAEYAGVRCAYPHVENLGVDRWLSIIAAAELYLSNTVLCIAGCGTATTVDFLRPDKQHLGGIISCGTDLIRRQLGQNTANIPSVDDRGETPLFARDTSTAVISGARYSVAGMIVSAVVQAEQQLGLPVQLLLTGGGAEAIMPLLSNSEFQEKILQDKELLMKGLAITACREL